MAKRKTVKKVIERTASAVTPFVVGKGDFDVTNFDDDLAAAVAEQQASAEGIGAGWPFVSTQGGFFSVGDDKFGKEMDVVIVAVGSRNLYYGEEKFDRDNIKPPICFAIGIGSEEMAPPKDVKTRELLDVQSETCEGCWANAFGTNDRGGKACGNYRRLAVIPALQESDLTPGALTKNSGAILQIPPSSLKNWRAYLNVLDKAPTQAIITTITLEDDQKTQFQMHFTPKSQIATSFKDPRMTAVMGRRKDAVEQLRTYPNLAPPEPKKPKKPARKKVTKKKTARNKSF